MTQSYRWSIFVVCMFALTIGRSAHAQTNQQLTLAPWSEHSFGETNDRILYQGQSHVKGEDANAEVFWWDSIGRFRLDKNDPNAPTLGYHWLTMSFDTNSKQLPDHLDEISMAAGLHLGKIADGDVSVVLGAGYSGNNPFADTNGIFGIGHVMYQRPLNDRDALILSLDYNGNSSFLPDIPLPGFAFVHRDKPFSFGFGFPDSWAEWEITPDLKFEVRYSVPYTASATLDYWMSKHVGVFGGVANFFNGFEMDGESSTNRFFYQMSRAEAGIRYRNESFWKGFYVDAALVVGYAFEQNFSRGFDVRDLDTFTSISDEPYIGLVIVGRL